MTPQQKRNIGRGVRRARQFKRRSDAMKESWRRRRQHPFHLKLTNVPETIEELQLRNNQFDVFGQIEQLALTWRFLSERKLAVTHVPQLEPILTGAIDRIRLEIILACRQYLGEDDVPRHTLD